MPRKASDRSKNERLNKIKSMLSRLSEDEAMSITEIWERLKEAGFKINRKTVERDLMEDLTLETPLGSIGSSPQRFYYPEGCDPDYDLKFTDQQLQTIILALENLKSMSSNLIKNLCEETEETMISKLPSNLTAEFEFLKTISSTAHTAIGEAGDLDKKVYETVTQALRTGLVFECYYHSPYESSKKTVRRHFAPLMLHFVGGAPYLFVYDYDEENNPIKCLRINRIKEPRHTSLKVDQSKRSLINLKHSFGGYGTGNQKVIEYIVYCKRPMAQRFEDVHIHPSQEIMMIGPNQYRIKFKLADSKEVIQILSQYGGFIDKIEPESVYEQVKEIWKKGLKVI